MTERTEEGRDKMREKQNLSGAASTPGPNVTQMWGILELLDCRHLSLCSVLMSSGIGGQDLCRRCKHLALHLPSSSLIKLLMNATSHGSKHGFWWREESWRWWSPCCIHLLLAGAQWERNPRCFFKMLCNVSQVSSVEQTDLPSLNSLQPNTRIWK